MLASQVVKAKAVVTILFARSAARTARWSVSFGENPARAVGDRDGERTAIFQTKRERHGNQGRVNRGVFDRAFDAVEAWNRHPRPFEHGLIAAEGVTHAAQHDVAAD